MRSTTAHWPTMPGSTNSDRGASLLSMANGMRTLHPMREVLALVSSRCEVVKTVNVRGENGELNVECSDQTA